ncbi:THUMP-like domain-containing protein [Skermania piniformis]|uniref:Class I SAM-dependent methyltransferase n=1 Tax=Skermania pinensis TaxID=39122 RepID=A0ABX8S6I1_9ACTN|nr:SAM-dependent methyltransferase [Skermania piniformis]QXQ12777.1 class I SAM-dependent methyltransferase [Skermania piniformis]
MSFRFTVADVAYLGSGAGRADLAATAEFALVPATLLADLTTLRVRFGERAAMLAETVRLRRRAATRLVAAADWLFTDEAAQQATATRVARYRATRLAGRPVHDVTCSIGAELAELVAVCPRVLGSDLDPVRLAMAAHNVAGAALVRADALAPCSRDVAVLADPGRRPDGRRTRAPAATQPPLPELIAAYPGRDLVVKCAPGLDFDQLGWRGEVELVSLDGGVREACLWSPGLSEGTRRRATVLRRSGPAETITDAEPDELPGRAPGEWIVDPDGAVVRAGLVRQYAARHGLWQLDPRIAYLTGDAVPAGVRGFRILDRLPLDERRLRRALASRDCGVLEILVRGVDVDPDRLRARLRLRGGSALTVVITRIGRSPTAFVTESAVAVPTGDHDPER